MLASGCFAQTPDVLGEVAQTLEGTILIVPHRESADGRMTACGLEFSALKRDFSTKGGAPVKVVGSFYMRNHSNGGLFYALKIGIADGLGAAPIVSAPANAFIRSPRRKAPIKARRSPGENPDYALFVVAVDDDVVSAYQAIAEQKQLVVGFNRTPGQMDVITVLDLTVIDTKMEGGKVVREKSQKPVEDFLDCTGTLFKSLKK